MGDIKIIIANGSKLVCAGLVGLLEDQPQYKVIAQVHNSADLKEVLVGAIPDLIIIDQTSKGFSVDDIRRCRKGNKHRRVLAITPEQGAQALLDAIRAGVTGYVKVDCSEKEIKESIMETAHGRKFFCGQILEVIKASGLQFGLPEMTLNCDPVTLSSRELEVIKMIAEGMTNNQIADGLFLSAHTINAHRRNIMQKLGVNNTAALVMYAVRSGMVNPNKFLFFPEGQA